MLSRFPFPLEKGDKLRAYYQIADLSRQFEIHLICTSEHDVSEADKQEISRFCASVHVFRLNKALIFFSLIAALFGRNPFQVGYFYQRKIRRQTDRLLEEIKPDHIYCQLVRAAEYVKNYHRCPKTLDYMDALSKGTERRAENSRGLKKWLFLQESRRLSRYERLIFDYFEHHTIISGQDRDYIMHPRKNDITLIPNGVDSRFFEEAEAEKRFTLVFTGNMNYPPNIEAARYIASRILPALHRTRPDVSCLISGANPPASLRSLGNSDFHVGGWVEDIRESYRSARIFVAPMMLGTGLQNKLLEAMAMGLPCITTTLANNALLAAPETEILIADDAESFAKQVARLLESPELYRTIAESGQRFVRENYRWEAANEHLARLLCS